MKMKKYCISKEKKNMRKIIYIVIGAILLLSMGTAMAVTEYKSKVQIEGNNIEWAIYSSFEGMQDLFTGSADSGMLYQTFTERQEAWNNFKDIERAVVWDGQGEYDINSNYNNPAQWYNCNVDTRVYGTSDDGGNLWQRKTPSGHSEPTWHAPDRRAIDLDLFGEYELGYSAVDWRGDDSGSNDFAFSFYAEGDIRSSLIVEEGNIGSEHGSGIWHNEDHYYTEYEFSWGGFLNHNIDLYGFNSVQYDHVFTEGFMFGNALVQ